MNNLSADAYKNNIFVRHLGHLELDSRLEDEITEVLEVKAAEFYVKRYVRRKYVRKESEGIAIGKLPNRDIEKGIPGASVLAMLIIGKFVDHLPIYRQIAIFKRAGIILHYNTVLDWTNNGLDILEPIYDHLRRKILASHYLQADETGLKDLSEENFISFFERFKADSLFQIERVKFPMTLKSCDIEQDKPTTEQLGISDWRNLDFGYKDEYAKREIDAYTQETKMCTDSVKVQLG